MGRSRKTACRSVIAKSCIIVGPGTAISALVTSSPAAESRW
jgi:hypothetical protein